uniref:Uncharacterized protein n=1 Tax=Ditylenchus dipsaci TaxID=166011 RepID=A0A915DEE3_9BILA
MQMRVPQPGHEPVLLVFGVYEAKSYFVIAFDFLLSTIFDKETTSDILLKSRVQKKYHPISFAALLLLIFFSATENF